MQNKKSDIHKALIVPVNSNLEYFIQDRRGFKKPDWGYFGGLVEDGETPLNAVIRETEEELSIKLKETDLINLGTSVTDWDGIRIVRHMYLYPTEQKEFNVQEGNGGYWFTIKEANDLMDDKDRFDDIVSRVEKVLKK